MAIFLVEQLAAPAALAELGADVAQVHAVAAARSADARVRWLQAAFVPDRAVCLSLVEAADPESVRAVLAEAGVRASVHLAIPLLEASRRDAAR
jgi:hypothetical protein